MVHFQPIEKVIGKFRIKTLKNILIGEFIWVRSEAYSFECNDINTNKLEGISKSQVKNF